MALNIKDSETERLATELARRTSTTKTGAIRDALRAQLAALPNDTDGRLDPEAEFARHLHVMESEVWPLTAGTATITKAEREDILGYGDQGV
jgi:antitoxin VapB